MLDIDGEFTPQEVDWDAANNEVDEYLNEPDDEDDGGGEAGSLGITGGGGMSEDEGSLTDESNSIIRYVPGLRAVWLLISTFWGTRNSLRCTSLAAHLPHHERSGNACGA